MTSFCHFTLTTFSIVPIVEWLHIDLKSSMSLESLETCQVLLFKSICSHSSQFGLKIRLQLSPRQFDLHFIFPKVTDVLLGCVSGDDDTAWHSWTAIAWIPTSMTSDTKKYK